MSCRWAGSPSGRRCSASPGRGWLGMLVMNEKRYDGVLAEHGQIVEAVEKCRKKAARKVLREHLEITENILLRKLDHRSRECGGAR